MDLLENENVENRHPWEIARVRIVSELIRNQNLEPCRWVDLGAGDQYVYEQLKHLGFFYLIDKQFERLSTTENSVMLHDLDGVDFSKVRGVLLLDVLEHVQDDEKFFSDLLKKADTGTIFFITVPAHQFLFSKHDQFLKHFRRYNNRTLKRILGGNKSSIVKCHYFFFSLFFVRALQKIMGMSESHKINAWKFSDSHIITKIIISILLLDYNACRLLSLIGINLPGLSMVSVVTKTS